MPHDLTHSAVVEKPVATGMSARCRMLMPCTPTANRASEPVRCQLVSLSQEVECLGEEGWLGGIRSIPRRPIRPRPLLPLQTTVP